MALLKIAHYRVLKQLGGGGASEVYLAEDTRLHRKVALKLLHHTYTQDPVQLQRFQQEAEWTSMLSHPNLLAIFEVGETDGTHYIATEFIDGMTLRKKLDHGTLTVRESIEIAIAVVSALKVAHEMWIVHRDIKPENIMLHGDGFVKVLDFGVAKLTQPQSGAKAITLPRMVVGTLQYLAPEQVRAAGVDPRTDLWAVGVVLFEMIAGEAPFSGKSIVELFDSIIRKETPTLVSPRNEVIPPYVSRIVERCLMKEPEERHQSTSELLADLKDAREELVYHERRQRKEG